MFSLQPPRHISTLPLATDRIFMADGRFGWIVLQKSSCTDDQKF